MGDENGDEAAGDDKADAEDASGGLADMAETIVEAVENATTEIFNATQVSVAHPGEASDTVLLRCPWFLKTGYR